MGPGDTKIAEQKEEDNVEINEDLFLEDDVRNCLTVVTYSRISIYLMTFDLSLKQEIENYKTTALPGG